MLETLETIWHPDGVAFAFLRRADGTFSDEVGIGEPVETEVLGAAVKARALGAAELVEWAPAGELGDSTRGLLAVRDVARRAVGEGLVHPQLVQAGGRWFAFWGATLAASVEEALAGIAAALPSVSAEHFHGDRAATVADVYPSLVDRIARGRLVAAGVKLGDPTRIGRARGVEEFLRALTSEEPDLPVGPSYASLERRITRWVDDGLARLVEAPWTLGLHLDERGGTIVLELWLHAEDDPGVALPASLLWEAGPEPFDFLRDTDPYADVARRIAELRPFLEEHGIGLDPDEPSEVELEDVEHFLRELMPQLDERGVPVLLPESWLRAPARIRANLAARGEERASNFLSLAEIARFDWQLAVGDVDLDPEELARLAALKSPVVASAAAGRRCGRRTSSAR